MDIVTKADVVVHLGMQYPWLINRGRTCIDTSEPHWRLSSVEQLHSISDPDI